MFGDRHEVWVTTLQPPARSQQAPVGCGHGFGEQIVDAPCQTLGSSHAASVVTVHAPDVEQHAPVG